MITVEPIEGLCNRMRVIACSLALARAISAELRVIWVRTPACGAPFSALFEPLADTMMVERARWANRVLRRVEVGTGRFTKVIGHRRLGDLLAARFDFAQLAGERSIFIQ